jgi:Ca2+-binding RTX toxin-like protein
VTWGDGTSSVVSGGSGGVSLEHVYTSAGTFTVRATTVDKDGAESAAKTQSIVIRVVELQSGVLAVGGATTSDAISLEPSNTSGAVSVVVNGTSYGSFTAVSEILIFGQAGNDDIRLQSKKFGSTTARIGVPTTVLGDDGNDVIDVSATTGNNILLGGSGNDSLFGGTGRDIVIGGLGADLLYGGDGDDLLIAGYTTYDASLTSLNAIRSEWTSSRTYATRIANLRGTGTGVRNNGSTFLSSSTVLNDTNIDRLFGESGLDWFWGKVNQDLFQDRSSLEILN